MKTVIAGISYIGRVIVGKLREWFNLFALRRETSALENRRDELLLRLGTRYHQFLVDNRSEPPAAVTETVLDLGAVLSRMAALDGQRRRLRQETLLYLHPEPRPDIQQMRGARGLQRREPRQAGPGVRPPASVPAAIGLTPDKQVGPTRPPAGKLGDLSARGGVAPTEREGEKCECGEFFPPGARFCSACGRPRGKAPAPPPEIAPPRKCPLCGAEIPVGAEFCPSCGGHADAEVYEM